LLGDFVAMLLRNGIANSVRLEHRYKRTVLTALTGVLDQDFINGLIYDRYDITVDEIQAFSELCAGIDTFPILLNLPLLEKLGRDYA